MKLKIVISYVITLQMICLIFSAKYIIFFTNRSKGLLNEQISLNKEESVSVANANDKITFSISTHRTTSNGKKDGVVVTENDDEKSFPIKKTKIQSRIDTRFAIMRQADKYISPDNTIRFYATDVTNNKVSVIKLYFKGNPINGIFFSQDNDPKFTNALDDCRNHHLINNRLYNKELSNKDPIDFQKDRPVYNIKFPQCLTQTDSGNLKTLWMNIFSSPEGVSVQEKCFHEDRLEKSNSCIPYLRTIADGVLKALKILNSGEVFFQHGNLSPRTIYLSNEFVYVDNMLYSPIKYDDIGQKAFRGDLNLLGDVLIAAMLGTSKKVVREPIIDPFDLYNQIKSYFVKKNIDINLETATLNMNFPVGKKLTRADMNYKLGASVFDFIYQLKCAGIEKNDQFIDLNQAINHEFLKSGEGNDSIAEQWGKVPSDF